MTFADNAKRVFDLWVEKYIAGDIESCVQLYTEDGTIYSPYGLPAIGRDALRETHRTWLASGETNKKLKVLESRGEKDLGYCVAAYSGEYRDENGSTFIESGTSLNIFARQPDGSWKIHISSLNSDKPPLVDG
ncbi:MAG: hypothetical protein DHS20C01_22550 [marine bacterium B5-7]|nr:MAG: hypothetical protein DHS20C01_22550 [marine bacterium B5-7]